jgi:predicted nucleic acid-binding protein
MRRNRFTGLQAAMMSMLSSIIVRLNLLRSLFSEIVVPPRVAAELDRHQIEVEPNSMRVAANNTANLQNEG